MYSQNKEEQFILEYFTRNKIEVGTFLDIGANDGVTLSNVRALAELGWGGVLVEPSKTSYNKAVENYKDFSIVEIYNVAISDKTGEMEFFESGEHLGTGDHSLLSSLSESETKRWQKETFTKTTVDSYSWPDFLNLSSKKKFDFISIDAEGFDLIILAQMDLDELDCKLVCVEWNGRYFNPFDDYFKRFNFNLIHENPENLIYGR